MAMYKSLFDLSPEQTASTEMPRTVVFSNRTGSGSMTIYSLFSGAELYYNDMHLVSFDEAPAPARNVIELNHCRVGRYECSFGENSCCYLAAGDFAVCAAARKKSSSFFPLRHYHGNYHSAGSGCDLAGNAEPDGMVWRESERYPTVCLHREPLLHPSVCACGCTCFFR